MITPSSTCPYCGTPIGLYHVKRCSLEQCPYCGRACCKCTCTFTDETMIQDIIRIRWTGTAPGVEECRAFGLFCFWNYLRMAPCTPHDPRAVPDLDRLHAECRWAPFKQQWVRRQDVPVIYDLYDLWERQIAHWSIKTSDVFVEVSGQIGAPWFPVRQYAAKVSKVNGRKLVQVVSDVYHDPDPYTAMQVSFDKARAIIGCSSEDLAEQVRTFRDMEAFVGDA